MFVVLGGMPACLPPSPSPLANSFVIGTVVINNNAAKQVLRRALIKHEPEVACFNGVLNRASASHA